MKSNLFFNFFVVAIIGLSIGLLTENGNAQTQLWGTSTQGGTANQGTIFVANSDGSNLHTVYNFVNATGETPLGALVLANNGKLYGVTALGGYNDSCVVFSYDPATNAYTDIRDLAQDTLSGYSAQSGMIKASDGMLYGLCPYGGVFGYGVIYKIDPSTDIYSDIHDFIYSTEGTLAYGSLKQLSDDKLYGMTSAGGAYNAGTIFRFDPTNSQFTILYSFSATYRGAPNYANLVETSDGKLYGMTRVGGANSAGVIFSYNLGTGTYNDLYDFDRTHGSYPFGSLMQATDGNLYGMTAGGGSNNDGVIFSFNINTGVYTDLLDFNGTNGSSPERSLMQGSTGKLFGTTLIGGANNLGVAFSYDIATSVYDKLVDFDSLSTGSNPLCDIIETPILVQTGISTINEKSAISIYPNPAANEITISNSNQEEVLQFYDLLGKELAVVKTEPLSKTVLDVSDFPTVFFVRTQSGEVEKIVRQ